MMHTHNMRKQQFKMIKKQINDVFVKYKLFAVRLEQYMNGFLEMNNLADMDQWREFIHRVDLILLHLPNHHTNLLKQIELTNKRYNDIGYSRASYYKNYKEAGQLFLQYWR